MVAPEGRKQWPNVAIAHLRECDSNWESFPWGELLKVSSIILEEESISDFEITSQFGQIYPPSLAITTRSPHLAVSCHRLGQGLAIGIKVSELEL